MDPGPEKIVCLQRFVKDIEKVLLDISGDVLDLLKRRHDITAYEYTLLEVLLGLRSWAMNNLFDIHCTDEEVRRFAAVNAQLYDMTQQMYERTRMLNEFIRNMPIHEKDDDVVVEANLKFWDDGAMSVLELEDDAFYCSDFARMIELLAMVDYKYTHLDYVHQICTSTGIEGGVLKVDDDIKDDLDDGTTWAEGWLKHPKLDHLVICHAVHDICTHKHYSIPDLLRMNTFEVSVEMKIQQIVNQDGSRCFWMQNYTNEQIKDKLHAEAEHRPVGISLGDFIYRRCRVYYDTMVDDVFGVTFFLVWENNGWRWRPAKNYVPPNYEIEEKS
jgi:hypothetical protein